MSGHKESEHEPDWRVASIRVVRWLKYTPEGRIDSTSPKPESVRVQFAASRDFAWFKAPKLEEPKPPTPPEEFIFLLSRPSTVMPYVLTDPMDLLPMSELSDVERLLRG